MPSKISNEATSPNSKSGLGALLAGGVAALLASTCCLGPLVLITLGFSGAWIGNLSVLEAYRHLFFAWRRIWRPMTDCLPSEVCALPRVKRTYQFLFGAVAVLVLVAFGFPYVAPWFY